MFLASRLGYGGSILVSFAGNMLFSFLGVETNWFFLNPYAISSRIVCPFFKMQPNGIPLENNSALLETGYVFPAVVVSLLLAVAILWGSSKLFSLGGNHHD